jgi:signal transduction histidine kinase
LQPQAQNKKITIINENTHQALAHAHKHSVNTVVRNLISNAIKFTPAEGKISLRVHAESGSVTVSVADTGVGMSRDIMDKLFRIDTKHTTRGTADEKGTGLGLILCKEFIEKNGGRIGVESEVGKGSVFHFTLPVQVSANAPSVITV